MALPGSLARKFEAIERSMEALEAAVKDAQILVEENAGDAKTRSQRDAVKALALAGLAVVISKAKGEEAENAEKQFEKSKQSCEKVRQGLSGEPKSASKRTTSSSSKGPSATSSGKPTVQSSDKRSAPSKGNSGGHKAKKQRH